MEGPEFKTCPYCREQIRVAASKCRFCGEWLEERPVIPTSPTHLEETKNAGERVGNIEANVKDADRYGEGEACNQPVEPAATHKRSEQIKVATLLYLVPLTYFLFLALNSAWTDLAKGGQRFSDSVVITTCLINTIIGFVERAFLSPLGLLCLGVYAYYVWNFRKTQNRGAQIAMSGDGSAQTMVQKPVPSDADSSPPITPETVRRPGLKPAAILLIINAVLTFVASAIMQGGAASVLTTSTLYRTMFLGDIICALALLSGREGWRWYVIARAIYGATYWGIITPLNQGMPLGWLIGLVQIAFVGGLLALVLFERPSQSRMRWAVGSVIFAWVAIWSLNAVELAGFKQARRNLLAEMPWLSPELLDSFLKQMAFRKIDEAHFQEHFSATLDKGRQQLTPVEREEVTQIYRVAYASLSHDEALEYSSLAEKVRSQQPLTPAEMDRMLQITAKALAELRDPYNQRFQELTTKAFQLGNTVERKGK